MSPARNTSFSFFRRMSTWRVVDVLRLVGERAAVDPDDAALAVEDAREALAEAAADAR